MAERIVHQYGAPFRAACGLTGAHRAHGDRGKVTCPDCLALPDDVAARADYDQLAAAMRAAQTRPIPPADQAEHDWKPTTNTLAVWKCVKCGTVGFDPHPLPRYGCVLPPGSTVTGGDR